MSERPLTVSEVTQAIKQALEREFPPIWVAGELANYTHHTSGHRYFTLKDEQSQIRGVMWRWQKPPGFEPEVGMNVLARGEISVYERGGQYQLYASQLFPAGVGQQQLALEALKRQLMEEGLFDEALKRPLPFYPRAIGVVTSRTGAALRDILHILGRRFPAARVVLRPVLVQGESAPEDIAQGIQDLNAYGEVDVLIVGRGGGATEDLAAFNAEAVVRAVRTSAIPVISAVGHEIDFTLADLAADVRAPTPSAAAELAVRDRGELLQRVRDLGRRASEAVHRLMEENGEILSGYRERYGLRRVGDLILQNVQSVDEMQKDLHVGMRRTFVSGVETHRRLRAQLSTLSPHSVLGRGYSLTQREEDGAVVVDAASLHEGECVRTRFARGEAVSRVEGVMPRDQ